MFATVSQSSEVNIKHPLQERNETKSFQENNEADFVCINIRGKKFLVLRENFERFPETRLGKLVN